MGWIGLGWRGVGVGVGAGVGVGVGVREGPPRTCARAAEKNWTRADPGALNSFFTRTTLPYTPRRLNRSRVPTFSGSNPVTMTTGEGADTGAPS